jgi:hypothetical protein
MTVPDFQFIDSRIFPASDISHPITSYSTSATLPIQGSTDLTLLFSKVFENPSEVQARIGAN